MTRDAVEQIIADALLVEEAALIALDDCTPANEAALMDAADRATQATIAAYRLRDAVRPEERVGAAMTYTAQVILLDTRPTIRVQRRTPHGPILVGYFRRPQDIHDHGIPVDLADLEIQP